MADIWAFIAEDSPRNASVFVRRIEERFEPLCRHPALGPSRDNLSPGLRAHFYRDYVIYYRSTKTELIIVRVVHGSRDTAALFEETE